VLPQTGGAFERRGIFANENGQRVFQFSTAFRERSRLGFSGSQFRFRARNVNLVANAVLKAAAHELNLFFPQPDGARDCGNFRVERPQRKIVLRHVRVQSEQHIMERSE